LEEDVADRKVKAVLQRTPIMSRWILLNEIVEKPNMSNAEMKHVVSAYVKEKFITSSLLQNARTMVGRFGNYCLFLPMVKSRRWKSVVLM
jgi:hypothetical protein